MPAIDIQNVSKQYRRHAQQALATTLKSYLVRDLWRANKKRHLAKAAVYALRNVSLQFARGRTVGVIGPNGSGKSTLLKLMSRILGPDAGKIVVQGKVAALIELGAGFHPELTGRENILINGVILGLTRAEVRECMAPIIAFADIGDFIDYPVRTYSSGMYARLGFAVAIHVDPDILLIDEILSVGDASFTRKCQEALGRFKALNKCIVVVSHDLTTVRTFCDDAVWLEAGTVRMQGPAGEVIDAYQAAVQ
jgi:lipopolysaccharide transport system ATP-binding protein